MGNVKVTRTGTVVVTEKIGLPGHPRFGEDYDRVLGSVRKLDAYETGNSYPAWTAVRGKTGKGERKTFTTRKAAVAWLTEK